jgi:type IV pilus assembly protein PilA
MRSRLRHRRAAFTLIELMIVVSIVGVLSVLATYGVRKYIANAKTAEARNGLGRMSNAAIIAYENEHMASPVLTPGALSAITRQLCQSASKTVPASISQVTGAKYQSSNADWSVDGAGNSGFACLHFTIDEPQYFMYTYTATGSSKPGDSFTATANGDLDGNGVPSTFQLTGVINASYVVNVAPNILEISPEE